MKINCEKYLLEEAIRTVSKAASPKSPLTALRGILLKADMTSLRLTTYDLRRGIYTDIEADVEDAGSAVIDARLFENIVRHLPDGMVRIVVDASLNVLIKCGQSEFNIKASSADDYPELPEPDRVREIEISQELLKEMIVRTSFSISKNESRPVYTGALFEIEDSHLALVAVDGYRLSMRSADINLEHNDLLRFIIPAYSLSDIEKICQSGEDKFCQFKLGSKHISVHFSGTVLITRRLEGEFLDYKTAVPRDFRYKIKLNRRELLDGLDRVSLMTDESSKAPVKLFFADGKLDLSCDTIQGRSFDSIISEGNGEGLTIGFNDVFLKEALRAIDEEEILFCLNTDSSPAVIKSLNQDNRYLYMVLPVRLIAR